MGDGPRYRVEVVVEIDDRERRRVGNRQRRNDSLQAVGVVADINDVIAAGRTQRQRSLNDQDVCANLEALLKPNF